MDDAVYPVTIPAPITIMGTSSTRVNVSTNGILAISSLTTAYANSPLPQYAVAPIAVFPCWDDLYLFAGNPQGIFYGLDDGAVGKRGTTFEYYLAQYQAATFYYHFLVSFWEDRPNVVTFDYLNMTNSGSGATVGINSQTGTFFPFVPFLQDGEPMLTLWHPDSEQVQPVLPQPGRPQQRGHDHIRLLFEYVVEWLSARGFESARGVVLVVAAPHTLLFARFVYMG